MREAVLARFELRLNHGVNIKMHNIRVVKDQQRHIIHLVGNRFTITILRDGGELPSNKLNGFLIQRPDSIPRKVTEVSVSKGVNSRSSYGTRKYHMEQRYLNKHIIAHSSDLGLFAAVKDLPAFMIRLLS